MAAVPMQPAVIPDTSSAPRNSLRALRLEQIQIWGAAAHARACAINMPFPERRSSLFEADFSSDRDRPCRRTARHSLVRLAGDDDAVSNARSDSDSDDETNNINASPCDDMVSRRPKVLRVSSIDNLDDDDDGGGGLCIPDNNNNNKFQLRHTPPDRIAHRTTDVRSSMERRRLFAARAKSAVRPDSDPCSSGDKVHFEPRARSFFEERSQSPNSSTPFARARASIRLLGRYSRSRTARFPFRNRFPNPSRHSTR